MGEKKKKELKAVNPMLFLVAIILIVAVASYIVPAGSYDRVYDAAIDREIVDPSSYHTVDRNPVSPFMLLMSVSLGIQNAAYIIAFLLVIGGMFAILNGTKAIETGMANVVRAMKGKELLISGKTVICALGQRSRTDVVEALRNGAPFVRVIGDARKVSTITNAVYQGYHAALDI